MHQRFTMIAACCTASNPFAPEPRVHMNSYHAQQELLLLVIITATEVIAKMH